MALQELLNVAKTTLPVHNAGEGSPGALGYRAAFPGMHNHAPGVSQDNP